MSEQTEENPEETPPEPSIFARSDAWTDLGLTLPIFLVYHLGVIFLPVRNAADPVTARLRSLANQSLLSYAGLTLVIGAVFVAVLYLLGRGQVLRFRKFGLVAMEGILYAAVLRLAGSWVMGALPLDAGAPAEPSPVFLGTIMSLGAGFYEEITFRVLLFGSGSWVIRAVMGKGVTELALKLLWAVAAATLFSAWHYVGPLADPFEMRSFVYRATCGFVLTTVYAFRGFAPAVWTHATYDVWAMVLSGS